jgi:hypothetical protein
LSQLVLIEAHGMSGTTTKKFFDNNFATSSQEVELPHHQCKITITGFFSDQKLLYHIFINY